MRNKHRLVSTNLWRILLAIAFLAHSDLAISQIVEGFSDQREFVSGTVLTESGAKIEGASIRVKGSEVEATTNSDGIFQIEAIGRDTLVVFHIGYSALEVPVAGKKIIQVTLNEVTTDLNEVVVVGYGQQKRISVTGSVSTLPVEQIVQVATPSLSNAIAGKIPGIITRQASGEPGYDAAQVFVRGMATFTNNAPLIIIDGVERDMNQINAQEIESFTVLKDATATAVYGLRGANGVIIINTKRGVAGKPLVTFRTEAARLQPIRLPEFVSGYEYASLWNEALVSNGSGMRWTDDELQKFKDGSDPYLYPNVNWIDAILKPSTSQTISNLSVTGGSDVIKYYTNIGYTLQDGLYRKDAQNAFNTNTSIKRYNFRSNVDINIFENLTVQLGLGGIIQRGNYPGWSSGDIFWAMRTISPIAYPITNPDGTPGGASTFVGVNPWARATQSGYSTEDRSTLQGTFAANWDLSTLVTEGLSFRGLFSYDRVSNTGNVRSKQFLVKRYLGKDEEGNDIYSDPAFREEQPMAYSFWNYSDRRIYTEAQINYARSFGRHDITLMALYNQTDFVPLTAGTSLENLPYRKQGIASRITYAYDDRYLLEGNLGYNGSENFPKGKRFGLFPAISAGWVVSNENFWELDVVNQLKFRFSYGLVGNDQIGGARFLFLSTTRLQGQSYRFGSDQQLYTGMEEEQTGNPNITWERARKTNLGMDLALFQNKVSLQVNLFNEYRSGILLRQQTVPAITGFYPWSIPNANLGIMKNKGIDGIIEIKNSTPSGFFYNMRGSFTFARNRIIEDATPNPLYPYMQTRRLRLGQTIGFVFDGYFKDENDVASSPLQTFGTVRVGDAKYKDINGDGKIDSYDQLPLGNPRIPEMTFGFGGTFGYKNIDFSVYFAGAANTSLYIGGTSVFPFWDGVGVGNITREYYDNRWTPETPDAKYPGVDVGNNPNNFVLSDLWMRNGNYLRLRNAEIGYNYPLRKNTSMLSQLRLFVNGTNLFTWDHIGFMDPESSDGTFSYPLQRSINIGVQVDFK